MQRHGGRKDLGPIKVKNMCSQQLQKEGANDLRNECEIIGPPLGAKGMEIDSLSIHTCPLNDTF